MAHIWLIPDIIIINYFTMRAPILIACFLLTASSIFSQVPSASETSSTTIEDGSSKSKKVPSAILDKFKTEYPNETPTWNMDNGNYRASFIDAKMMNGHAVAYDKNGAVVYREEQLAKGDYPQQIDDYFMVKYPQSKHGVWSSMDISGKRRYFSNHEKEIVWFDENGKYVKTVKRTSDK
jgi:hypothetical protein